MTGPDLLSVSEPAPVELRIMAPDTIGRRITGLLLEEPTSVHSVTGQIGVGKTTELLDVRDRLRDTGIAYALYLDYADYGIRNAEFPLLDAVTEAMAADLGADEHATSSLAELQDAAAESVASGHAVTVAVLIDGMSHQPLSRLKFDLWKLRRAGIGTVATRSLHDAYEHGLAVPLGIYRWNMRAMGTRHPGDVEFLRGILEIRDPARRLDEDAIQVLIEHSGGLPRDLVALLRGASHDAYRRGSDRVTADHVREAVTTFGKGMLIGLTDEMRDRLNLVVKLGAIQPMSRAVDRQLLAARCLVEVASVGGRPVHVLHPTIRGLL